MFQFLDSNQRKLIEKILIVLLLLPGFQYCMAQKRVQSDDFFSPGNAAAKYINFDNRGFIIHGQRTFIISGSIHYPRVPQENWHDILLKLKRAGFNTVETYIFWNYHENKENVFDFTSSGHDIGAFLTEAQRVGLYAIVRVGPYICSEWENGGYPTWLTLKPGMQVRNNKCPAYFEEISKWFNKVLPIISAHQIQRGGNVILVQLENEQPTDGWKYWGTTIYGDYFNLLLKLAHNNGLEVPMFFSGMHHAFDPAPAKPIDVTTRKGPWISTELWTTWFDRYGNSGEDLLNGVRHPWRVVANGGNGFNLYMFHGGTNFGYFNFSDDEKYGDKREKAGASYDFGTLVGQTGDTRELYLRLKRLGYLVDSFHSILSGGFSDTISYQDLAPGIHTTVRTSKTGSLIFLDNPGRDTVTILPSGARIRLDKGEIAPLGRNIRISRSIVAEEIDARMLALVPQKDITTLICYGKEGESGNLKLRITRGGQGKSFIKNIRLSFQHTLREQIIQSGQDRLRLLYMDTASVDRTWIVKKDDQNLIFSGAAYLGDVTLQKGTKLKAAVDDPWGGRTSEKINLYSSADYSLHTLQKSAPASELAPALLIDKSYSYRSIFEKNDQGWFRRPDNDLPEMGEDRDTSAYAWYNTGFRTSLPITAIRFGKIGDRATFYLDGRLAGTYDLLRDKDLNLPIAIAPGQHRLTVFVAHFGRRKFAGYTGPIHQLSFQKGLRGPVIVNNTDTVKWNWAMLGGVELNAASPGPAEAAQLVPEFHKMHFSITKPADGTVYRLNTNGLSYGSVWLNGHNVGRYPEIMKGCPGLWLPSCWMKSGNNTLIVFDEQGKAADDCRIGIETQSSRKRQWYVK